MEIVTLKFGKLRIGDSFIVGEIDEGADIQLDAANRVKAVAEKRFRGKKWGYISNRINSYSLNPLVYVQATNEESDMTALAVVTRNKSQMKQVEYEKSVSAGRMKFECFLDLESAISWMTDILDQEATDA